jgi:hypothetical protein
MYRASSSVFISSPPSLFGRAVGADGGSWKGEGVKFLRTKTKEMARKPKIIPQMTERFAQTERGSRCRESRT